MKRGALAVVMYAGAALIAVGLAVVAVAWFAGPCDP